MDQQSSLHSHRTFDSVADCATDKNSNLAGVIAIKIIDGEKNVVKTFIEKKDLIVGQMRSFAQHIGRATSERKVDDTDKDIVDIQISCDAKIFQFLIDCCTELHKDGKISD